MVNLQGYKINSLSFENSVQNGTQLKLQNKVKYNVSYIDSENRCLGTVDFRVIDADMQPFEIRVNLSAEFVYGEDDEKADIHADSFDQIFPFLRQIINTVTTMSGMPALMIPIIRLDRDKVAVNDRNEGEESPLN